MSETLFNAIIAGVVGLGTGALGSLVAPWVSWGIEKRRKTRQSRLALIDAWQSVVASPEFDRSDITRHPTYGVLRSLIGEAARKQLERPQNHLITEPGRAFNHSDVVLLQTEVARIQKMWGLI